MAEETEEELRRRIAELETRLDEEKSRSRKDVYLKVSAKGGVSLYGVRRFPVTFYVEEWEKILGMGDDIRSFCQEHASELKRKGEH